MYVLYKLNTTSEIVADRTSILNPATENLYSIEYLNYLGFFGIVS